MTLDATKPTDQEVVAQLPYWIRQTRAEVNSIIAIVAGDFYDYNVVTLTAGTTTIDITTHLTDGNIEAIRLAADGACTLTGLTGGEAGQIKVFVFVDSNITLTDGAKDTNGHFYLNQLPALSNFDADVDDILALINIGGDGGVTTNGYWKELWRQVSVK
jgi:hypothetical protein